MRTILNLVIATLLFSSVTLAEDINAIFSKVNELVKAQNYTKALEELGWAKKEIEKMNSQRLTSFFPDSLAGYTGGQTKNNSALGLTQLEKVYNKGETSVTLTLTGSTGGAGANSGLGGIAAFGQMAAMMNQGGEGQETFRLAGKTATLVQEPGSDQAELTVFLDGAMLKLEMNGGAKAEDLKAMANGLKLEDLYTYLKG